MHPDVLLIAEELVETEGGGHQVEVGALVQQGDLSLSRGRGTRHAV